MTTNELIERLEKDAKALRNVHAELFGSTMALRLAHARLAKAEHRHTLAGLEGKNEATRKAQLAELTQDERAAVDDAEAANISARHMLTIAELNYRTTREIAALHRAQLHAAANQEAAP